MLILRFGDDLALGAHLEALIELDLLSQHLIHLLVVNKAAAVLVIIAKELIDLEEYMEGTAAHSASQSQSADSRSKGVSWCCGRAVTSSRGASNPSDLMALRNSFPSIVPL